MMYHVETSAAQPAYMQLYFQLREDVIRGLYPWGTKLPSKRFLAAEAGVSVITVEHAYGILCEEGYLQPRERSGFYVIYRQSDCVPVALPQAPLPPSPPASGSEDAFPFGVLAKTMRRVLSDYGQRILMKPPNSGCPQLREAICRYLARSRGIIVEPRQVVIGSGAEYLYSLIVQLLGKDRIYALERPCYDKIRRVYLANGASCDMLRMGADGILSEELARTQATVLHVTPFNSYPSRITASASKRTEYLRWAQRKGAMIVEDDFDSEFTLSTKAADTPFSLEPERTVIYLNTFSQTIAPSMRAGYMVLPAQWVDPFEKALGFYSCTVPVFEQYVLSELINSGDFERHINRVRRARRRRQRIQPAE